MPNSGNVLGHKYAIVAGQASPEDALAAGKYPASASFIDVGGTERFHVLVHVGALDTATTITVQSANAANGTPTDVSGTEFVIAATDDDQVVAITVETAAILANGSDHRYVTLDVAGATGSNDFADILFLLEGKEGPVTQNSTLMPSGNVLYVNS